MYAHVHDNGVTRRNATPLFAVSLVCAPGHSTPALLYSKSKLTGLDRSKDSRINHVGPVPGNPVLLCNRCFKNSFIVYRDCNECVALDELLGEAHQ